MVAVQMILMNYFLVGLKINNNDVLPPPPEPPCSLGCSNCDTFNGCHACKAPFLLELRRTGFQQKGVCTTSCQKGFYAKFIKKFGSCIRCGKNCEECHTWKNFCTNCPPGKYLYRGRCRKKCPFGHLHHETYKVCISDGDIYVNGSSPFSLEKYHYTLRHSTKKERKRLRERRRKCKLRRRERKRQRKKMKKERRKLKIKTRHKKGRRKRLCRRRRKKKNNNE